MSTSPRSHASMSGVTPFLSCGGRTGRRGEGDESGQASSRRGARRGRLAGDRSRRGERATGGAEGRRRRARSRGDRPGTPGRRRRETPRRPLPRPRRSPRGAAAASSSPTARRGEGRVRRVDPSLRSSRRRERRLVRRVSVSTGGVHRSSPRARLGRASFQRRRPTSRRFLGPDTWAFLTRPSRVVPLDDRQRLVFVASILRRTRPQRPEAARRRRPGPERARAPSHTRSRAPNAGDRPRGSRGSGRARERRSRGAGSGSGVAAGVSARTIVG